VLALFGVLITLALVTPVHAAPPVADFLGSPVSGATPLSVSFTDLSYGPPDPTNWSWDFDNDGTEDSTEQNPSYIYSTSGNYTVSLTATSTAGSDTNIKTNYITVYTPASADFSATPTSGPADLAVTFTDLSTGGIDTWSWDFDNDGTEDSTEQNPVYTYNTAGSYTVKLSVSGPGGSSNSSKTDYITVYTPAVANFSGTPTGGTVPLTVTFTDASTGDVDTWSWDFDNDGTEDSTEQNPSFTYNTPGTYSVALTASGLGGSYKDIKTDYITVYIPASSEFSGTPTSGPAPLAVTFTDDSTGDVDTWSWDFDNDGTEDSTEQNPSYTYSSPGTYTVALTASGPGGSDTNTKTDYITVYTPAAAEFSATPTSGPHPLAVTFTDASTGDVDTWSWDFDNDGTEDSTEQNPLYTYNATGTYTVALTASGLGGADTNTKTDYITVYTPAAAEFSATPTTGIGTLAVTFTDASTGDVDTWSWDFDNDGTEDSTEQNPLYTYNAPGTYTVALTASGLGGADTNTKTDYITVYTPAAAEFTGTPTSGPASLVVTFTDVSTGDVDTWSWDFDDDGTEDSTQQNPSYTYSSPGTYTVSLTASGLGGSDTIIQTDYITVYVPASADFTGTPVSGPASLAVNFTNASTGDVDTWSWDFDNDGTEDSTEQNPSYTYNSPGTYAVSLTASGLGGSDTNTKIDYITVYNPAGTDFSATPTGGPSPLVVNFTDLSTGDIDTWTPPNRIPPIPTLR
jgi:PKD repeat protein